MSHLYEGKIQNMGNAGRNGGEYYTPRPLIKTIVYIMTVRPYTLFTLKCTFKSFLARDLPRFFDQVGHQTTNASIENKHFFTK